MEDTFFGFNTTIPVEDGGGEGGELSEGEYDALNDETFGSAIKGDWESQHESLVRMDVSVNGDISKKDGKGSRDKKSICNDEDLEINLSRMKMDDVDITFDDDETTETALDPSVWSNKNQYPQNQHQNLFNLRQNFSNSFGTPPMSQQKQAPPHQPKKTLYQQYSNMFEWPSGIVTPPTKICTLEDIEKNILLTQQKQQIMQNSSTPKGNVQPPMNQTLPNFSQQQQQQQQQNHHSHQENGVDGFFNRSMPPPGFNMPMPRGPNLGKPRMPPGFPPLPVGYSIRAPTQMPILPIALNNFAMHPNFNAMRPLLPQQFPHPMMPHPQNSAQYNQQMVHEIQRNHPLLSRQPLMPQQQMPYHLILHQQQMMLQQLAQQNNQKNNMNHQRSNGHPRSRPEEYDEYANLMSTRDKHWLIGIQLTQLNSDTPYIDDYYYTIYKERKSKLNGEFGQSSKTHKDNQLNHPFSQPKGRHAQLVLVQLGNKNGNNNSRNGMQNRERRNSENSTHSNDKELLKNSQQFENSLGKLQYGSVTAPRKLIDMNNIEKVRSTTGDNKTQLQKITAAASVELSSQRKYRLTLLHIETLFKILLKIEDYTNPSAIATFAALRERQKQKEDISNVLAGIIGENNEHKANDNNGPNSASQSGYADLEPKENLIEQLLPGLTQDKIIGMMNVRKGRVLICRILPHLSDNSKRWDVWCGIFLSIQNNVRKDIEELEVFTSFCSEFKKQIQEVEELDVIVTLGKTLSLVGEKKSFLLFSNKLCMSSLVELILQAEKIYNNENLKKDDDTMKDWTQFLNSISSLLGKTIQTQTISFAINSDAIKPLGDHFSRFKDLKLEPLLNLFSQK